MDYAVVQHFPSALAALGASLRSIPFRASLFDIADARRGPAGGRFGDTTAISRGLVAHNPSPTHLRRLRYRRGHECDGQGPLRDGCVGDGAVPFYTEANPRQRGKGIAVSRCRYERHIAIPCRRYLTY